MPKFIYKGCEIEAENKDDAYRELYSEGVFGYELSFDEMYDEVKNQIEEQNDK